MKVVFHETIGMNLPIGFRARLGQRGDEQLPIPVIVEDRFPPVAAVQDVINRAGIFHAELACHARNPAPTGKWCQYVGLTPSG